MRSGRQKIVECGEVEEKSYVVNGNGILLENFLFAEVTTL